MLNRPEYKKLVATIRDAVEEMKTEHVSIVAITKEHFSYITRSHRDFDESWPRVMKELGLVDDGTGTETWTVPGYGLHDRAPEYKKDVEKRFGTKFAEAIGRRLEGAKKQ